MVGSSDMTLGNKTLNMTRISGPWPTAWRTDAVQLSMTTGAASGIGRSMAVVAQGVPGSPTIGTFSVPGGSNQTLGGSCRTDVDYSTLTQLTLSVTGSGTERTTLAAGSGVFLTITITDTTPPPLTPVNRVTSLALGKTVSDGQVTLQGSGATAGTGNAISGYAIQYCDSADGSSYTGWAGYTDIATSAGSFSVNVSPPPTRGHYRRFRALTLGAAGLHAGAWCESGALQRCRITGFSLTVSQATAGAGSLQGTLSPMLSTLTHRITWRLGGKSHQHSVAAGTNTFSFAPPPDWIDQIPGSGSGQGTVAVETLENGSPMSDVATGSFSVLVPASIVPGIGSLTAQPETGTSVWGLYLQGISKARITAGGVQPGTGASITSLMISGSGASASGGTLLSPTLTAAGDITFTATATDSRGRTAQKQVAISVAAYTRPEITGLTLYRADANGQPDENGTRILGNLSCTTCDVGENAATLTIAINEVEGTPQTIPTGAQTIPIDLGDGFAITQSYRIALRVMDELYYTSIGRVIATVKRIMNIGANIEGGVALGKMSEYPKTLELADDWDIRLGQTSVKAALGLDRIYPVGSVYMSTNATNPGQLFGGTWAAFGQGRVIVGAGSNGTTNYTAGTTGGSESHGHTVNSHNHSASAPSIAINWGGGTTTGGTALTAAQQASMRVRNISGGDVVNIGDIGAGGGWTTVKGADNKGWQQMYAGSTNNASANGGAHTHPQADHQHTGSASAPAIGAASPGTSNDDSRQPYVVCYMWVRTA